MGLAASAFPPDGTVGDLATGDLALVARRAAARTIDTVLLFATLLAVASAYAYAFRSEDGTGAMIVAIDVTFVLYLLHELLLAAAAPGHRWPHDSLAGTRVIAASR